MPVVVRSHDISSVGNRVLVPLIRDFQQQFPGTHFDVLLDDHFTDLAPWEFHADCGTVYRDMPAVLSFNNVEAEVEAVLAGIGIGQLADYMVARELAAGRLVEVLPQPVRPGGGLYMYCQQRAQMPLRVRRFIDFVTAGMPLQPHSGTLVT